MWRGSEIISNDRILIHRMGPTTKKPLRFEQRFLLSCGLGESASGFLGKLQDNIGPFPLVVATAGVPQSAQRVSPSSMVAPQYRQNAAPGPPICL
jgi:hypothetical protein